MSSRSGTNLTRGTALKIYCCNCN